MNIQHEMDALERAYLQGFLTDREYDDEIDRLIAEHKTRPHSGGGMMTNADFAEMAAHIARKASAWAGDCLILRDMRDKPLETEAADRFIRDIRGMIDHIEEETRPQSGSENQGDR
jgi:hypothetical protein